ncbi:hypothetical protein ACTQYZ_01365 [Anaerofustis sp. LCP19S3_F7]
MFIAASAFVPTYCETYIPSTIVYKVVNKAVRYVGIINFKTL